MKGSPSPTPPEPRASRGRVVTFRAAARTARRPRRLQSGRMGVVVRVDDRRWRDERVRRESFVTGAGRNLLRFFRKVFRPRSTIPTDVTHGSADSRDNRSPSVGGNSRS